MKEETKYCQNCSREIQGKVVSLELSVDNGKYYDESKGIPKGHESQGLFDFGERCAKVANKSNHVFCGETELHELYRKLLKEYYSLKDSFLGTFAERLYDACLYDIEGFEFVDIDDNEELEHHLEILEKQVKALRKISKGLSELSFTFG
jgi:hypothetical protein